MKKRPNGFFSRMSNDEFIDFIKNNYSGLNLKELTIQDTSAYHYARKRKIKEKRILDILLEQGVLYKDRRSFGSFSDEELFDYVSKNYSNKTLADFTELDSSLISLCYERKIIDKLVESGVLKRERAKNGYFKSMNNKELLNYIKQNYYGIKISELKSKSKICYNLIKERDLMEGLIGKGILYRDKSLKFFFKNLTKKEFIDYFKRHFNGYILSTLRCEQYSAYHEAINKKVLDQLIDDGIIIRKKRSNDFFSSMTDQELINFVKKNYNGKTLSELSRESVYSVLRKRKLRDKVVSQGIIIRGNNKRGYNDFVNVERALNDLIKKLGYFPKGHEIDSEDSYLRISIYMYHGGIKAVKERMGYLNSNQSILENLLEEYTGGND